MHAEIGERFLHSLSRCPLSRCAVMYVALLGACAPTSKTPDSTASEATTTALPQKAAKPASRLTASTPIVELISALRPKARTALLLGAEGGTVEKGFDSHGFTVTVVDPENGTFKVLADATYDVIYLDARDDGRLATKLLSKRGLAVIRDHLGKGGVIVAKAHTAMSPEIRNRAAKFAPRPGRFSGVFGSGIGQEDQDLYLLGSTAPLSAAFRTGSALWPKAEKAVTMAHAPPAKVMPKVRSITVSGYIRRDEKGALWLDAPHQGQGSVRFALKGPAAEKLGSVPTEFVTNGDIGTDGDVGDTLHHVFGGGGSKRSDVRLTGMAAALTGTATLLSVIHSNAASKLPTSLRGDVLDDRIPYGGALFNLKVDTVHWSTTKKDWPLSVAPPRAALEASARKGDLAAVAAWLASAAARVGKPVPNHRELIPRVAELTALAEHARREAATAKSKGRTFSTASACDRLRVEINKSMLRSTPMARGLYHCALDHYETVAKNDKGPYGEDAVSRLSALYKDPSDQSRSERSPMRKKLAKLRRSHPNAPTMTFPPSY